MGGGAGGRRDRLVPKAFIQKASQVRGSTTLLSRPGVIRGSLLHSQSPNARPLYLRSKPLRLASPGNPQEGLLPGPQRAGSQDPRRLAPGPKEGCPEEGRARCVLPRTPTSRRGVQAPPPCSGGAQTMTNRTRRADAASKRDTVSARGAGAPGGGASPPVRAPGRKGVPATRKPRRLDSRLGARRDPARARGRC